MIKLTKRQEKIRKALGLNPKRVSPKGWYITDCPYCGSKMKFGIIFTEKYLLSFNCFKCQEHGTGSILLRFLGHDSLLEGYQESLDKVENPFLIEEANEEIEALKDRHPPLGWRRVKEDEYLSSRGFAPWQYEKYKVGRTKLFSKLKDYVIFLIEENGANKGYLARITWDKEKIEEEESKGKHVLRYTNEGGVDFGMLVFGIDEIDENTQNIIFVEGITDKFNVERLLNLQHTNKTVVVCTFGKKLSVDQVNKVITKGVSIQTAYLLFDPDAIEAQKRASMQLESAWSGVSVLVGTHESKDPGDYKIGDLTSVINNAQPPSLFVQSKVGPRVLKR